MMDPTNDYHHQRNQQASGFHNNNNNSSANDNNNGAVDMKDHLIAGQEGPNSFNQSQSGFQLQQPAPPSSPGENSSPESKFNSEKFVTDIQVSLAPSMSSTACSWSESFLAPKNFCFSEGKKNFKVSVVSRTIAASNVAPRKTSNRASSSPIQQQKLLSGAALRLEERFLLKTLFAVCRTGRFDSGEFLFSRVFRR
jgi:hypothetical protein